MNGNERREQTIQLQKELLAVSFIFCVHFRSFPFIFEFLAIFDPKKAFFGHFRGLLGHNRNERNILFSE
jgi:hypothetical protein